MISRANCYFLLIANYFILVRRSACKSWKKNFPYESKSILSRDSSLKNSFLFTQLESKVLEIKSKIKRHYLE